MSKEYKNIDDLFRSELAGLDSVQVPERIKKNIDKKVNKKRRFGFILFALPLLALLAIGGYLLVPNESNTAESNNINTTNEEAIVAFNEEVSNEVSVAKRELTSDPAAADKTNLEAKSDEVSSTVNKSEEKDIAKTTEKNQASGDGKKLIPNKNNTSTSTQSEISLNKEQRQIPEPTEKHNTGQIIQPDDEKSVPTTALPDEKEETTSNSEPILTDAEVSNHEESSLQSDSLNEESNIEEELLTEVQDTSITDQETDEVVQDPEVDEELAVDDGVKPDRTQDKNTPWMVSLTSGLDLNKATYEASDPVTETTYQNAMSDKKGYEVNLDVSYTLNNGLNNGLNFGAGIGFQQFLEDYHFLSEGFTVDSSLTWTYLYDSLDTLQLFPIDSNSTAIYDTVTVTNYDESGQVTARYLHVPIRFGMQLQFGKKWLVDLYGVLRYNYLFSLSGKYVDSNSQLQTYSKTNLGAYKKYYFDFGIGAKIHFNLFRQFYLTGTLRYNFAPNLYSDAVFVRKNNGAHFGLGFSYRF